jgi:EAL domain-containing protein (putative c-di-GMP-specific phosphodiesterase class I)
MEVVKAMKQLPNAPRWIALITFVLSFVAFFFALGSFKTFLARRELSSQAATMLRGFREGYDSARLDLANLPPVEGLNCQNGISDILARRNFDEQYVRWFGVVHNGSVICRGGPAGISLSDSEAHHIDDTWSLLSVRGPGKTDNLGVVQRRGDTLYLALLEPLLFDFLHPVACRSCVSYHFIVRADPLVDMMSNDTSDRQVISHTVEGVRLGTYMKFTLSATQQYVNGFSIPGRFLSAALAVVIAATIAFALYLYLTRRTSVAFLIEEGLKRHEFLPYYQPIVDSRDGSVLGAEALVRWRTNRSELIPPGQFIPYAEENNLIGPITSQLVENILIDIRQFGWQNTDRFISINAVADQIADSSFCEKLIGRLAEQNIPAKNLSLEITERYQFSDLEQGRIALQCLVDAGIEIKLDDAGTGYGGFSYVQELPIETLKIDKMFIDTLRMGTERDDPKRHVLHAIIGFAKATKLDVIAEGVETEDQVARLRNAGVYAIQGYVYARPMPAEEFLQWMQAR